MTVRLKCPDLYRIVLIGILAVCAGKIGELKVISYLPALHIRAVHERVLNKLPVIAAEIDRCIGIRGYPGINILDVVVMAVRKKDSLDRTLT